MKSTLFGLIATGLAAALAPQAAHAQLSPDAQAAAIEECTKAPQASQKAVDACTKLINNLEMSPTVEVTLRYLRGSYLVDMKDYNKALLDLDKVVAIYDTAPDKANWRPEAVEKVAWSYPWRAQAHEALKQCDAATADYIKAAQMARELSERDKYAALARQTCK